VEGTENAETPGNGATAENANPDDLDTCSRTTATWARCSRRAEFQASLNQSQRQSQKQNGGIAAVAVNAGMPTTATGDTNAVRWTTAADNALRRSGMHGPACCLSGSAWCRRLVELPLTPAFRALCLYEFIAVSDKS
jgi:hypothetical protein